MSNPRVPVIPSPATRVERQNALEKPLAGLADLWCPKGTNDAVPAAVLARFARTLIKDDGTVLTADEIAVGADEVIEVANFAALPVTGVSDKIYVTIDTAKTYRWTGSVYAEISATPAYASQAEAEAGADNVKLMTPLRSAQAIAALAGGTGDVVGPAVSADNAIAIFSGTTGKLLKNSGETVIVSAPLLFAQTWNDAAVTFVGKTNDITNTASAVDSLLDRWRVGGTTLASISKTGQGAFSGGAYNVPWISTNGGLVGLASGSQYFLQFIVSGIEYAALSNTQFGLGSGIQLGWNSSSSAGNNAGFDAFFMRKAAASIQLGADAAGVTDQTLTTASRITSDGVGSSLTLDSGNGRGAISGSLIFRTAGAAGAGVAGTYAKMLELTGNAKIGLYGVAAVARAAAITAPTAPGVVYAQAEAAAMKTAVDAIRVALSAIGITS